MLDQVILDRIREIVGASNVEDGADMRNYTSFKAGGKVACLAMPMDNTSLMELLQYLDEKDIPHLFLGNGSNTLFKDCGYSGVVVKLNPQSEEFSQMNYNEEDDTVVTAGTAMLMSTFAKAVAAKGLSGFEPMSGIPGSLGGACFMNAGAYGGEMKDVIISVHGISPDGKVEKDFSLDELDLGYRHSALEELGYIATSVTMKLTKDNTEDILDRMKEFTKKRNSKQPVQYPSAGSFFKRPTGYFAGKLVEDAGLKGLTVGGAQVSSMHSGFVINIGNATETDITDLMHLVQNTVKDRFGVDLEPEVRIVGDK